MDEKISMFYHVECRSDAPRLQPLVSSTLDLHLDARSTKMPITPEDLVQESVSAIVLSDTTYGLLSDGRKQV
jgi:hypothetical protein